ncbi:hypothetical protein Tco_0973717 [Tanacetum coccineum]
MRSIKYCSSLNEYPLVEIDRKNHLSLDSRITVLHRQLIQFSVINDTSGNDPSFFLDNKTGAPYGEDRVSYDKLCQKVLLLIPIILSSRNDAIDRKKDGSLQIISCALITRELNKLTVKITLSASKDCRFVSINLHPKSKQGDEEQLKLILELLKGTGELYAKFYKCVFSDSKEHLLRRSSVRFEDLEALSVRDKMFRLGRDTNIDDKLRFVEEQVEIMDCEVKCYTNKIETAR